MEIAEEEMRYVLQRVEDAAFVADMKKSKTGSSYTRDVLRAEIFTSFESAQRSACENEIPVALDTLFGRTL